MAGNGWTFLSNYGHVLVCLARDPDVTMREVAGAVGITERAVQQIVSDLVEHGFVLRAREGRRNRYTIVEDAHLRHPLEGGVTVGAFLALLAAP